MLHEKKQAVRRSGGQTRRLVVAMLLLTARPPVVAAVQCPDGTPPPCAGARAAVAPDLNRIAILPFRVTTADSLLGEGLAELLATEFTGESGPRAAHMGTVLRAWRRAGGGLRSPLAQAAQLRLAREIGCGLIIEGRVIGLGSRLSLSASVVQVAGGSPRSVGPISGPADSLEALVGRLASGLLGATGSTRVTDPNARLTDSPQAMRAYLEGLSVYRRGAFGPAAPLFERALALDSGFARAALLRWLTGTWAGEGQRSAWAMEAFRRREQLSAADRILLTAYLGERHPARRSPEQHLADRRRAVALLPESPEAHAELGEYLYHVGTANGIADPLPETRSQFERSLALDSLAGTAMHLLEIALTRADTLSIRTLWAMFDRLSDDNVFWRSYGTVAAARIGDSALAVELANRRAPLSRWLLNMAGAEAALSASALGSGSDTIWYPSLYVVHGRPEALRGLGSGHRDARYALFAAALFEGWDSSDASGLVSELAASPGADSNAIARRECLMALWRLARGRPATFDAALLGRHGRVPCAATLDLLEARRSGAPDLGARLLAADSLLRWDLANEGGGEGFEHVVIARVWEERGDPGRALSAWRLTPRGFGWGVHEALDAREQGRLAAQLGDTTAAIRAYRRYLDFRRDAEPALIPQRDSVAAALARLERR